MHIRKSFGFSVFCLLFLFASVPAAAREGGKADALDRFLAGLETLSADFEQTMTSESGEELEQAGGTFSIQRPGKFKWTYEAPYAQVLTSDGRTLWVYDQDLEQVTIRDAAASIGDSPGAVLGGDVDIDKHYIVTDLGEEGGVEWIELTPRNTESEYASIRLGFTGADLAGMVLHDNLGQRTSIAFSNVRRNVKLEEGSFSFEPPAGVDVIDSREQQPEVE